MRVASVRYVDESAALRRKLERGGSRALKTAGERIERSAKTSLKVAPRFTYSGMNETQRAIYDQRVRRATARGRRRPGLPRNVSKPGDPPFITHPQSQLKTGIRYALRGDLVVVGPVRFRTGNVPEMLEYGTARVQPRPFMRPALSATINEPGFSRLFKDMT